MERGWKGRQNLSKIFLVKSWHEGQNIFISQTGADYAILTVILELPFPPCRSTIPTSTKTDFVPQTLYSPSRLSLQCNQTVFHPQYSHSWTCLRVVCDFLRTTFWPALSPSIAQVLHSFLLFLKALSVPPSAVLFISTRLLRCHLCNFCPPCRCTVQHTGSPIFCMHQFHLCSSLQVDTIQSADRRQSTINHERLAANGLSQTAI